jgi:hypothetical protein
MAITQTADERRVLVKWLLEMTFPQNAGIFLFFLFTTSISHCATRRKVAGSIPDGVFGIFH